MEKQTGTIKNLVKIIMFILRKGKKKLILDLSLIFKRGKIAGKSFLKELVLSHHHHTHRQPPAAGAFTYRDQPPEEYEFSCSNTPAHHSFLLSHVIPGALHVITGKKGKTAKHKAQYETIREEMEAINSALESMSLNDAVAASPAFQGLVTRQLRVTDSPFPISGGGGDSHVDEAAEEFIERFYTQLKRQPLTDG